MKTINAIGVVILAWSFSKEAIEAIPNWLAFFLGMLGTGLMLNWEDTILYSSKKRKQK